MRKQAPSLGRILTMVVFALSCFGLLLFLWLSFGGPIPLKPEGYRFKIAFPEATQLAMEADVRVAGVTVGKVRDKELDPGGNRTVATIEVERRFAPVRRDARAILRQKTLLGETYVELTPGTPGAPMLPEGGRLRDGGVRPTVELDEIFQALDPATRQSFHVWQQDMARAARGRGGDLSDAFGNLPEFATATADVLGVLDRQSTDVRELVQGTGTVFEALTRSEGQLRGLIVNSGVLFRATASQNRALAETFRVFPTFLDESRATFARLERFARDTRPLIRDLEPAARDLAPTLRSLRRLAPDLRRLFLDLSPLVEASRQGLPALRDTLTGLRPLLGSTGPFLEQLNPILKFLELYQRQVQMFITNASYALAATGTSAGGGIGHYLRQIGPAGPETVSMFPRRSPMNRGNAYLPPLAIPSADSQRKGITPLWDCVPSGGPVDKSQTPPQDAPTAEGTPPCWVSPPVAFGGRAQRFPQVTAADYGN